MQLEADRSGQKKKNSRSSPGARRCLAHLPLSLEEGRRSSQQAGLLACGSLPDGLLPKAIASVDLARDSPLTVTGSRRIRTGFPFQLVREPPAVYSLVGFLLATTSSTGPPPDASRAGRAICVGHYRRPDPKEKAALIG